MKFYLEVDLKEDDVDLYKFTSLHLAVRYIQEEKLESWTLSDSPDEEFPENSYELIG